MSLLFHKEIFDQFFYKNMGLGLKSWALSVCTRYILALILYHWLQQEHGSATLWKRSLAGFYVFSFHFLIFLSKALCYEICNCKGISLISILHLCQYTSLKIKEKLTTWIKSWGTYKSVWAAQRILEVLQYEM